MHWQHRVSLHSRARAVVAKHSRERERLPRRIVGDLENAKVGGWFDVSSDR